MELIANTQFVKTLLGFAVSFAATILLTIVTGISIATGEPIATCVILSVLTIIAIIGSVHFVNKMEDYM